MAVAIVGGTGDEGFGIALRLARAGREVVIGSRDADRGAEAAERARARLGGDAPVRGTANAEAVAAAEAVLVTVPFAGQAAIYKGLKDAVEPGQIVCDCTSPLATAVGGFPWQVIRPWQGSAAEQAKAFLPDGVRLASGFHTVSAEALQDLDRPLDGDVLLAGDDEAKAAVGALAETMGLRWVDAGPITAARLIEPLTAILVAVNRRYGVRAAGVRLTGLQQAGPGGR